MFAARKELPKKQAELFVRTMFEIVQEYVVKEGIVKIKGLGTFKLINVESRSSVDVSTGERIRIESHSKITFTPDKALADQVNKPFAGFTTVILNPDTKLEDMEAMELNESLLPELAPEDLAEVAGPENTDAEITEEEAPDEGEAEVTPESEVEQDAEEVAEEIEEQEEQPTETVEGNNDMNKELQAVDPEVIRQMVQNAVNKEMKKQRGVVLSWGWVATCLLLVVALLIGSFMLGYRMGGNMKPLSGGQAVESKAVVKKSPEIKPGKDATAGQKSQAAPSENKPETEKAKADADAADSEVPANLQVKPVEATPAVVYEQMPGGAYEIVGVKGEHVMKAGDNLLRIARKNYGNSEFSRYIIFFNHIENPDVVPLGAKLKLPELVKK